MTAGREALRALLARDAILWASETQPIRHRDGAPAPWAFYSWQATLANARGLTLAATYLLERLAGFRSTQIASIGYTGLPLVTACVMAGGGRYAGVAIRDTRKTTVACRRIDGKFDPARPVVIVDDSLSSGTSLRRAIEAVEDEGGEVEGAVALVHFPGRGGIEWAAAAGYRVECLFDIWTDLGMAAYRTVPEPSAIPRSGVLAPNGLHPAALARWTAMFYLRNGLAPLPPNALDRPVSAPGGTFVSLRLRDSDFRLGRDGTWHFPGEHADPLADTVEATIAALRSVATTLSLADLERIKFAVTYFGPLEPVTVAALDFARKGIVVRGRTFPRKQGGALPNTQVFISEIEQLGQARDRNAKLDDGEPFDLFRHDLEKCVEAGETWLPYGCPEDAETNWWRDTALGGRLTRYARCLLTCAPPPEADFAIIAGAGAVAVRLYRHGLVGYGLAEIDGSIAAALARAIVAAKADPRWNADAGAVTIVVSVLHHPEHLGAQGPAFAAWKLRRGLDAIQVGSQFLLPSALVYNTWTKEQFVAAAGVRAGAPATTWMVAEWKETLAGAQPMRFGFPVRDRPLPPDEAAQRLASWLFNAIGDDLAPRYACMPTRGEAQHTGAAARRIHGLYTLSMAGRSFGRDDWRRAGHAGTEACLGRVRNGRLDWPGASGGDLADAVLLAAANQHPDLAATAAACAIDARLRGMIHPDGRIGRFPKRLNPPDDHRYLPGAVLAAVAEHACVCGSRLPDNVAAAAGWYRWQFAADPNWGAAGWLPQGFAALHHAGEPSGRELIFAAGDWAVDRQLAIDGAFLETLSPDEPSFNTGFIAEGIAAAWSVALAAGDGVRASRYAHSWEEAARFMHTLLIVEDDLFCMPRPALALGGVRCSVSPADVRVDQVSHWLHALLIGLRCRDSVSYG